MRTTSNTKSKTVLIAGSPEGIALDIALRFAVEGDDPVILDLANDGETALLDAFDVRSLPAPPILREAGSSGNAGAIGELKGRCDRIYALILALAPAAGPPAADLRSKANLFDDIERNAWPMVEYTRRIHEVFGSYPRRVVGVSSLRRSPQPDGAPDPTAAESLDEVFARYLSYHLFSSGVAVNMIRVEPRGVPPSGDSIAKLVFALTSGLMDAVRGQTLTLLGSVPAGSESNNLNPSGDKA
jgi:NAD(P)-dependent dehydrogenase (short-subunit alcohol dehydrogenase family)